MASISARAQGSETPGFSTLTTLKKCVRRMLGFSEDSGSGAQRSASPGKRIPSWRGDPIMARNRGDTEYPRVRCPQRVSRVPFDNCRSGSPARDAEKQEDGNHKLRRTELDPFRTEPAPHVKHRISGRRQQVVTRMLANTATPPPPGRDVATTTASAVKFGS